MADKKKKKKKKNVSTFGKRAGDIGFGIFMALLVIGLFALIIGVSMFAMWITFNVILGYSISTLDLFIGSLLVPIFAMMIYIVFGILGISIFGGD
jgi:hypothetical protein